MFVSEIIILAAKLYGDYDSSGSTDDEKYSRINIADWLQYYTLALQRLVLVRPDANYTTTSSQLTANNTKQNIPTAGLRLIDISRNMGVDGLTPGVPITKIARKSLDEFNEDWHTDTGETAIDHFSFDLKTPKEFFVYPKPHASTAVYIEMDYSIPFSAVLIADIATTEFPADEMFQESVIEWMLKLAFSIDTDSQTNLNISIRYENSFYQGLGLEFKSGEAAAPKGG